MPIKNISLAQLTSDPIGTLTGCADSGEILVVEMPDSRFVAIQSLDVAEDDGLVDQLIAANSGFRDLLAKANAGPVKDLDFENQ